MIAPPYISRLALVFITFTQLLGPSLKAQSVPPPDYQPISWNLGPNTAFQQGTGNVVKTGSDTTNWNADATSSQKIIRDGGIQIDLAQVLSPTRFAIGLSVTDSSRSFETLDYAFIVRPVSTTNIFSSYTVEVYESNVSIFGPVTYTRTSPTGPLPVKLSITRTGSQIRYWKDDTLLATSTKTSSGTLIADCSIRVGTLSSCTINTGDLDRDDMPDAWEKQNLPPNSGWTDLQNFQPTSQPLNPTSDPDADGLSNRQEFLDGTNPNSALSYLSPVSWTALPTNTELVAGGLGGIKKKAGVAAGWTAGGISTQKILEDGQLSFRAPAGSNLAVGLSDIDAGQTQADLDFAFILASNNTVTIKRPEYTTNLAIGEYNSDTVFCLQRIAGRVQFLKDGVVYATSDRMASSGPLQADCSLNAINAQITECRIYTGNLDSDTLPDSWELNYLPSNATLSHLTAFAPGLDIPANPSDSLPGEDSDGRTIYQEWLDGTNPASALSVTTPVPWLILTPSTIRYETIPAPRWIKYAGGTLWTNAEIAHATTPLPHSGRINFRIQSASSMAVGLTYNDGDRSRADLEFAISVDSTGNASVFESNNLRADLGTYTSNTTFSIQRLGGTVSYLKDGIVYHTSAVPATAPLIVNTSFNTVNSALLSANITSGDLDGDGLPDAWEIALRQRQNLPTGSIAALNSTLPNGTPGSPGDPDSDTFTNLQEFRFGTDPLQGVIKPMPISWKDLVNTSPQGNSGGLKKNPGITGTFNADATSEIALPGDGRWNFTAAPNALAFGLTYANNSRAETDLEYAFVLSSINATIRRPESTTNLSTGAYTQSTVFGIQQTGSHIEFLRDGLVVYASSEPVTSFLRADCSISTLNHQFDAVYQNSPDLDNDGLPDEWELRYLPLNATWQQLLDSHPTSHGTDNDGVDLWSEYQNGTSPVLSDSDNDGMPDTWEIEYGLAANDRTNTTTDFDGDGLSNLAELQNQTNPTLTDTDNDGIWDGYEVTHSLNPLASDDAFLDKDGDRIPNIWEFTRLSSASNPTSIPSTDATVDPALTADNPAAKRYRTLNSAYAALSTDPAYRSIIRVLPGIHSPASIGDGSNFNLKKVAILGQTPASTTTPPTFSTLSTVRLVANADLYVDGLILQNSEGAEPALTVRIAEYNVMIGGTLQNPQYQTEFHPAPNVRIVNCLFRNFNPTVSGTFTKAGAIMLESGVISIEHSTFLNCGPRASSGQITYSSILAPNGGITFKNSIVWDTGNGTNPPSANPVDLGPNPEFYTVSSCLIQGGTYSSIAANPNLDAQGRLSLLSSACFGKASSSNVRSDIWSAPRPATNADLGPEHTPYATLDTDGDDIPDWYEFANGLNLNDPSDSQLDPDQDWLTNFQEWIAGTDPQNPDTDGDGYNDGIELNGFGNPLVGGGNGGGLPNDPTPGLLDQGTFSPQWMEVFQIGASGPAPSSPVVVNVAPSQTATTSTATGSVVTTGHVIVFHGSIEPEDRERVEPPDPEMVPTTQGPDVSLVPPNSSLVKTCTITGGSQTNITTTGEGETQGYEIHYWGEIPFWDENAVPPEWSSVTVYNEGPVKWYPLTMTTTRTEITEDWNGSIVITLNTTDPERPAGSTFQYTFTVAVYTINEEGVPSFSHSENHTVTIEAGSNQSAPYTLAAPNGYGYEVVGPPTITEIEDESYSFTTSASDASGPKYRRMSLQGYPLSDSPPAVSPDAVGNPDDTYLDALGMELRHSVQDVKVSLGASLLNLAVRRELKHESWTMGSDIPPNERPDRPFGVGWQSNLAATVLVKKVQPYDGSPKTSAIVTDEEGNSQSFSRLGDVWVQGLFETNLSKVRQNTLEDADVSGEAVPEMRYVKRNGTVCQYQKTTIAQKVYSSGSFTEHHWFRLLRATDRWNNVLVYEYPPGNNTLIPNRIYRSGCAEQALSVKQSVDGKRVLEVQGPDGQKFVYGYDAAPLEAVPGNHAETPAQPALKTVTQKGGTLQEDITTEYQFVIRKEIDPTPVLSDWRGRFFPHLHVILESIKEPNSSRYEFKYEFNSTVINSQPQGPYCRYEYRDLSTGGAEVVLLGPGIRAQLGLPPMVTKVEIKDLTDTSVLASGATLSEASFSVDKHIRPTAGGSVEHCRANSQSIASDGTVYQWQFSTPFLGSAVDNHPDVNNGGGATQQRSLTLFFEKLRVVSPLGYEEYEFDFGADMEVKKVRDFSGNVTQYEYDHPPVSSISSQNTITPESPFYFVFRGANNASRTVRYSANQPTAVIDALGRRTEFSYAPDTLELQSTKSPANVRTTYVLQPITGLQLAKQVYDANNLLVQHTSWLYQNPKFKGFATRETHHELSGNGLANQATDFSPDNLGRLKSQQKMVGTQIIYSMEGHTLANQPRWKVDAEQRLTEWQYDALGRPKKMLLPDCGDGRKEVSYVFDPSGNLIRKTNENGELTFHAYDRLNRRTKTTMDLDRDGVADGRAQDLVTEWTYFPSNQVSTVTDPRGLVLSKSYDEIGRLQTETAALGTVQATTTGFVYGANSGGGVFDRGGFKPTQVTDPAGRVTTTVYDALYRAVSVTVPDGGTTTTVYDAAGNPTKVTDALTKETTTTFDALNRPTSVLYHDGEETSTRYTSQGWIYETVDELGRVTTTVYDTAGRKAAVLQPETDDGTGTQTRARPTTLYQYDREGNITKITDPLGHVTDTTYDARNRAVLVMAPPVFDPVTGTSARPSAVSRYDGVGNVVKSIDALGNETDQVYDAANRLVEKLGSPVPVAGLSGLHRPKTTTTYDANGNVLTVTDPNLTVTTNTYDAHNRLSSTQDGADITVSFGYDAVGNRTSVTDGKLQTTTFTYDGQKRLLTETGPGNHLLVTNTYNALNKTRRVDAKGVVTEYAYDHRHRLKTVLYPGSGQSRAYAYDAAGRITGVGESDNPLSAVGYAHDELGRVIAETSQGVVHTHAYDLAGKEVQRTNLGTGRTQVRSYDGAGRLVALTEGGRQTAIHYDLAGRVVARQMGNGNWAGLNYDALGRVLISTTYQNGTQNPTQILFEHEWDYDLAGNVKEQREIWPGAQGRAAGMRTTAMAYDGAYRLTQETVTEPGSGTPVTTLYSYDDANNRLSKVVTGGNEAGAWSYTSNALNQLTAFTRQSGATGPVAVSYTYDANGNRETRVAQASSLPPETTTYAWDNENRLIEVDKAGAVHRYEYDYRTRRISREEPPAGGGAAVKTAVVFAGGLSVAEYVGNAATPTVEYVRGPDLGGGVGGMLYTLRPEGGTLAAKYSYANGRGDVVAQANQGGTVTWTASYEAFGTRKLETGTNADRQRANTKEEDPTGLLNEGFRYRDLETGTWLSRDPAGFVDGPNLYAYVQQNPWTKFDPEGLYADLVIEAASIGAGISSAINNFRSGNMGEGFADLGFAALDGALAVVPGVPGGTGLLRQGAKQAARHGDAVVDAINTSIKASDAAAPLAKSAKEISNETAERLLKMRGAPAEKAKEIVESFDGPITATRGKKGDVLTVTETEGQKASGQFATRGSAGATPDERIQNLALPNSNKATVESKIELTRDQVLLEGKVASQMGKPDFHPKAKGGGQQVVTDAKRGGTKRVEENQ